MSDGCKDCRFAKWERTKAGRIKKGSPGRCLYVVELPPMPISVTGSHGYSNTMFERMRAAIWCEYTDCPTFERKENANG